MVSDAPDGMAERLPLNWPEQMAENVGHLPAEFVLAVWKFLLVQEMHFDQVFQVSWLELTSVIAGCQDVQLLAGCPKTGRWLAAGAVPFAPHGLTLAAQPGRVRRTVCTGILFFWVFSAPGMVCI